MQNRLLVTALVAACNDPASAPIEPPAKPPVVEPEHVAPGVPHGGMITNVAITEAGDAAVSVDGMSGLRLWPSLDGKHEAIPFAATGVEQVAITHTGEDLLVGLLDQAGTVTIVRFSRAGAERGRTSLPAEPAANQIVAVAGTLLVQREDQVIERYDAGGVRLARLGAPPGVALGGLTARTGMAAVLELERTVVMSARARTTPSVITTSASHLRFISLADRGLAWGAELALAETAPSSLAISPDHKRFATIAQGPQPVVNIYDVSAPRTPLEVEQTEFAAADSPLGFADSAHVGVLNGGAMTWVKVKAPASTGDRWRAPRETANDRAAAFGDNLFVAAIAGDLVMMTPDTTSYLGWQSLATGNLTIAGPHVGLETGPSRVIWLDHDLVRETEIDTTDLGFARPTRLYWIDPYHAVFENALPATYDKDGNYQQPAQMSLVDFRHRDQKRDLGTFGYIQRVEFQADVNQLVIADQGGIHHWAIDIDHDRLTELPVLKTSKPIMPQWLRMLDPARAHGVVAIVSGYGEGGQRTERFVDTPAKQITGVAVKELVQGLLAIGPRGELVVRTPAGIEVLGDTKVTWPAESTAELVTLDPRGERAVTLHGTDIAVTDLAGVRIWKQSVWGAQGVLFTGDGLRVIVRTMGGLVLFDAATGKKLGTACGFMFGVMTKTPLAISMNAAPVCEESGS